MADELTYSTIVFDKVHGSRPQVRKEEDPIYADVKTEKSDAPIPEAAASGTSEKNSPGFSPPKPAIVCLGVLCALILSVSVALCVYFSVTTHLINTDVMHELELLRDNQSSLITEYQGLKMLYANLTTETEMLESDVKNLSTDYQMLKNAYRNLTAEARAMNWTLERIFQFSNFPVDQWCPLKNSHTQVRECKPCLLHWMLFNSKCYLFSDGNQWNTWSNSRKNCLMSGADLVVIDSKEEQEFINSHSLSYYDKWHGYWIGLMTEDGTRRWVNGAPLTEEYWNPNFGQHSSCVLTNSSSNPLESWKSASCYMHNRWICESNTLIIQN
ncbi:hypothetical protein AGOR_G00209990 [Albula goreensis]|uniref:C-type lectin domain-containing protein n=1 Tax=Albula goreensis TaxID=1534307 RepID=A0A8T3CTS7_9TELE|nr:hypothetical protein AGOR_G00209990 [Albula goreensis]